MISTESKLNLIASYLAKLKQLEESNNPSQKLIADIKARLAECRANLK